MVEQTRQANNAEHGAPSFEELSSATEVMHALVRVAKGLRMYLPNNPVLIRFSKELDAKMSAHLERYGEYRLDVEPFQLRYQGAEVYESRDPKESIAFRIHADGIRSLIFSKGVEQSELTAFLGIIAFERGAEQDDDVVTQLWERNLHHVSYLLVEDFLEMELDEEQPEPASQQEAISRLRQALAGEVPPLRTVPKSLVLLTRDEAAWLRKVKQEELYRNSLDEVINILFAILAGVEDPALFADFLAILANLTENMMLAGDFVRAFKLIRFQDQLQKHPRIGEEQRALVQRGMAGILSDRTVQALQELIDSPQSVSHEELREILQMLGLSSLAAICELLGRVEKLKMRKVIIEVLVELGGDRPEVFTPFLSDPRWYLVRNVVLVLSLLDTPVALEMIVGLISHKEQRIRKEVLGFLERSPDPKAKPYILKYLRDQSRALRIKALQILAREKLAFALKPALALANADDFKGRAVPEKVAVCEAIGELGGAEMIPMFREMLLRKRWFKKRVEKEVATCAIAGLTRIRHPEARRLLEETRSRQHGEVRAMIDQALTTSGQGRVLPETEEIKHGA
jgi:HEAT repeat protein